MGYEDEEDESLGFARKFRPSSLKGYIGNTDVKETIFKYLKGGKRPQTMLFMGNSGCGKTTLARIVTREYRCEDRDDETGACGECLTCQTFEEYIRTGKTDMITDVYEIDASDKSGKKDIDSMIESMEYPAMSGDWKTYIIDEAHLLSKDAMGRLLKSLEEPPKGVLIIICTTDPDTLLPTIKNRCQLKLKISKPSTKELVDHLQKICITEGKNYDLEGLRMLVSRADNVIRDSLNYLETVLATRGDATAESVSVQFRQVNDKIIYDFYNAYLKDDYIAYADVIYRIKVGYDFGQFLTSLTQFTVRGLYIINSVDVEGLSTSEIQSYLDLFRQFKPTDLSKILKALRQMPLGNIEANLMAFIYCKEDTPTNTTQGTVTVTTTTTVEEEHHFRNNNLQALERKKAERGMVAVSEETKELGVNEILSIFNLEKVNK